MVKRKKKRCALKQDENCMCLHLFENINDTQTMFEGYYGRRRLKTTVALIIFFLVLMALLYRREGEIWMV
jgi:hypothetical protein